MPQLYDFTVPELNRFRELCNFSSQELEYFNLRAKHKSNVEISLIMHVPESEVNDAIKELQESSLTLSNARNLSALINVRDYLQNVTQSVPDSLERELNDILPQYKEYCAVKRQYQLGRATDDSVVASMRLVCKEVKEFLLILYQNTDTQIERNMIKRMLKETEEAL